MPDTEVRQFFSNGVRPIESFGPENRGGIRPSPGGAPDPVDKRCEYTSVQKGWCRAYKAKGTRYCIGHARSQGLL